MNRDILMQALKIVVMVVTLVITRYVIPYLKAKTDAQKIDRALAYIREGVRAAEQIYDQKDSKIKKKYVLTYGRKIAGRIGLDLSEEDLEMLIEAAVKTMNDETPILLEPATTEDNPEGAEAE